MRGARAGVWRVTISRLLWIEIIERTLLLNSIVEQFSPHYISHRSAAR